MIYMDLSIKKIKANLKTAVRTYHTWQKVTLKRMHIVTLQRNWRQWAVPLSFHTYNVKFLDTRIFQVCLLCFMIEYEVMRLDREDLVDENLNMQLSELGE